MPTKRRRDPRWQTPAIFIKYPHLLDEPPQITTVDGITRLRWVDQSGHPALVVAIFMTTGQVLWDYTIQEPDFGFLRHHTGTSGDPDQDPWTDVSIA